MKILLGSKAKDIVTGFTGIITGHYKFLTGCDRYQITPGIDKEGAIPESMSFDENSIEIVGEGVSKKFDTDKDKKEGKKVGGPVVYKTRNAY